MEKEILKQLFQQSGYAKPTAYSFLNGNRVFLNSRQKDVIRNAIKHGMLEEILSLPDEHSHDAASGHTTSTPQERA